MELAEENNISVGNVAPEPSLKRKAVNGVLWKIGEQGASQVLQLGISMVLARLIMPDQFGMIAMLAVFTAVANVFIESGFSSALMRKTDRTQADCSTVYWYNIIVSVVCYVILFACAPLVGRFYNMPQLCPLLRVTSLSIVIGSLTGVHSVLLGVELRFKELTKFRLLGMVVSGVAGIAMAYMGFGVWALVAQMLVSTVIGGLCVWFKVSWRPSFIFSRQSFREFFSFGSRMLGSAILDTMWNNVYPIVIGKVYNAADLAFYNRGWAITGLTSSMPAGILQSVTFPTLCKLQNDDNALKSGYRRTLRISAFVIFPLCVGAGAVAFPLINVLFTEVWIYAATLLSIVCFCGMWYPIHAINLNYLIVKGRSDLFFRLEVIKKIQGIVVLCATVPFGIEAMCYGSVASSLLCLYWNTRYTARFLNMGFIAQMRDLWPVLLLSLVMFAGARAVAMAMGNGIDSLVCAVAAGAAIYLGGAVLFRFPELNELRNLRK